VEKAFLMKLLNFGSQHPLRESWCKHLLNPDCFASLPFQLRIFRVDGSHAIRVLASYDYLFRREEMLILGTPEVLKPFDAHVILTTHRLAM